MTCFSNKHMDSQHGLVDQISSFYLKTNDKAQAYLDVCRG